MPREFKVIADDLHSDGALREFYIRNANRADWDAILKRVNRNWKAYDFSVDGEARELPLSFETIEHLRREANPLLSIQIAEAYVNCHFFGDEEIEFDFRPEDFRTPERWVKLCEFFQDMVDAVGKSGIVTYENMPREVIDNFEPSAKD